LHGPACLPRTRRRPAVRPRVAASIGPRSPSPRSSRRPAAGGRRQRGERAEALALLDVALEIVPANRDALWLAAVVRAEQGDRAGGRTTLPLLRAAAPDEPRAVVADLLDAMAGGRIQERLAEVEEAMCRNVDVGEALFDCCVRILNAEEALERAAGSLVPLGPGWPVAAGPALLRGARDLYLYLPSVFNSTRFTDRYFVDQATFMRYNGERLARVVEHVLASVTIARGARVLDAGCGNGFVLRELVARFGVEPWGHDNSESLRAIVQANVPGVRFHVGDLGRLPHDDGFFDVVLSTDVLEHLEVPERTLAELVRVTRPGGQVLVSVPDGRRDQGSGHVNFFSPEGLVRLCRGLRHDPVCLHRTGLSVVIRP
jgi:hypothetical protein